MPELHPPEPYSTVRRVPGGLPFVLRNRMRRLVAVRPVTMVLSCLFFGGFGVFGVVRAVLAARPAMLAVGLAPLVGFGIIAAYFTWYLTGRGPTLSADADGLWIRANGSTSRAIWLPWWSIEWIYLRQVGKETSLCVRPHEREAGSGAGGVSRIDQAMAWRIFGAPFAVRASIADQTPEEILAELRTLAADRCRVG